MRYWKNPGEVISDKNQDQHHRGFVQKIDQWILKIRQNNRYGNRQGADDGNKDHFDGKWKHFKHEIIERDFDKIENDKRNCGRKGNADERKIGVLNKIPV